MLRFDWLLAAVLLLAVALWLGTTAGCGQPAAPVDPPEPAAADDPLHEYADELAALSPEDRALAERQEICPVSGQPLGSMGTPVKVTVEGRDVLLCCQGCAPAIEADPEKYLAKLPE